MSLELELPDLDLPWEPEQSTKVSVNTLLVHSCWQMENLISGVLSFRLTIVEKGLHRSEDVSIVCSHCPSWMTITGRKYPKENLVKTRSQLPTSPFFHQNWMLNAGMRFFLKWPRSWNNPRYRYQVRLRVTIAGLVLSRTISKHSPTSRVGMKTTMISKIPEILFIVFGNPPKSHPGERTRSRKDDCIECLT